MLYRKIAIFVLITGVTTSSVMPLHSFAIEQIIQKDSIQQQGRYTNYSLGPERLQDVMKNMESSILKMDSYSQTILEQKEADFNGINSLNNELQTNIINHQKDARTNATYWKGNMKPYIIQVNQDIVNYSTTFQEYYATLLTAINQNDKGAFKNELGRLHHSILENKREADKLLNELISYRNKLSMDTQNFKQDVSEVNTILASHDQGIPLLQQQINRFNDLIKKNNDLIIAGGVLCVSLIGCIAGGPMIATAKKNISNAEQEIQKLNAKIAEYQAEVGVLTNIKNEISSSTATIDIAITSLQNISNNWHSIGAKYNNLLQNIESISPDDFIFIKEDLNTAKDSWEDLKGYADKLYEGTLKTPTP